MESADFYKPCIEIGPREDGATILAGFHDIIKKGQANFRLVSYYKSLPLSYPATIAEIEQEVLDLDINQQQAVALEADPRVFLKCGLFGKTILGKALDVNVRRMTAKVRDFSFVEVMADRRNALRLEVMPHTEAEIRFEGTTIPGQLRDVSLGGLSIVSNSGCSLPKLAEVTIRTTIPCLVENTEFRIEAKACHVGTTIKSGNSICRFAFDTDMHVESLISRYIFQRQVEIIKELKELALD